MPTFALAIPHTPWIPERVESVKRLLEVLETFDVRVKLFTDRVPNHEWSEQIWKWGAASDADWLLTLNDDVRAHPDFWEVLRAMVTGVDERCEVICLETVHPAASALFRAGYRWLQTNDMVVGVGYLLRTPTLRAFLNWRSTQIDPSAFPSVAEDTLVALYCASTAKRVWSPLPTIIDHDLSLASTYGNDHHPHRRPIVRLDALAQDGAPSGNLFDPREWGERSKTAHVGQFYESTPKLVRKLVRGWSKEEADLLAKDIGEGTSFLRRFARKLRAEKEENAAEVARLFIAMPTKGNVHPETCTSVWRTLGDPSLYVTGPWDADSIQLRELDVVRARSFLLSAFLRSDCTHCLWVDSDIAFSLEAIRGLLRSGHDFVGAPYPRRQALDWEQVRQASRAGQHPESFAYRYAVRLLGSVKVDEHDCFPLDGIGFGCLLMSRKAGELLEAECIEQGRTILQDGEPIAAPFMLQADPVNGDLLSEDLSCCALYNELRARRGEPGVHAYVGPGSPVSHHGDHCYRGHIEAFGLHR